MADASPAPPTTDQTISNAAIKRLAQEEGMVRLLLFEAQEQIVRLTAERDAALKMAGRAEQAGVSKRVIARGQPAEDA